MFRISDATTFNNDVAWSHSLMISCITSCNQNNKFSMGASTFSSLLELCLKFICVKDVDIHGHEPIDVNDSRLFNLTIFIILVI